MLLLPLDMDGEVGFDDNDETNMKMKQAASQHDTEGLSDPNILVSK